LDGCAALPDNNDPVGLQGVWVAVFNMVIHSSLHVNPVKVGIHIFAMLKVVEEVW